MRGPISSESSARLGLVALTAVPVVALDIVMIWFSAHPIAPSQSVEGSFSNPLGLIASNFVYDGWGNAENLVASSAFLLLALAYLPGRLRVVLALLESVVGVLSGVAAQVTTISTAYVTSGICTKACSFYGMSAVSNAIVGFTLASFSVAFGLVISKSRSAVTRPVRRSPIFLALALVTYIVVLLVLAGVIALPSSPTQASSTGGGPTPPPAIFTQTPPVWVVHSASLAYGFVLALAAFALLNRGYALTAPRRHTLRRVFRAPRRPRRPRSS